MKKFITTLFSVLTVFLASAQEKTVEITINGEAADMGYLWKVILLIIFSLAIIVIAARTFRGKSNV